MPQVRIYKLRSTFIPVEVASAHWESFFAFELRSAAGLERR